MASISISFEKKSGMILVSIFLLSVTIFHNSPPNLISHGSSSNMSDLFITFFAIDISSGKPFEETNSIIPFIDSNNNIGKFMAFTSIFDSSSSFPNVTLTYPP